MSTTTANPGLNRRTVLKAGAAAIAAPALILGRSVLAAPRQLTFAWNQNAHCLTSVVVAQEKGFFEKNGVRVDLLNYTGSTDQLLEAISTGKADAGVGMIHRWLKPLEAGFDVKLIASSHGGCQRVLGVNTAGVTTLDKIKGKTIGVSDMASPGKHWFSIYLLKNGIDPDKDVEWRQYPGNLLSVAADKGEVQVIADADPLIYVIEKNAPGRYTEVATNLSGEYAHRTCCVIGARGEIVRNDKPTAAGIARSIVQATDYVHENPQEAAKVFAKYAPNVSVEDIVALYRKLNFTLHPTGADLQETVAFYARDFQKLGILKKTTDPDRFAANVFANVLG